jgi:DNA-binding NtrC family response regulator
VRRLGDTREIAVDVRVIAATHQDLEEAVRERRFREDLYYRLARLVVDVPPLRQREGDVGLLAVHFVELACRQHRTRPKSLAPQALERLVRYEWPGNVRELKHACERAVVLGGDPIAPEDFGLPGGGPKDGRAEGILRLEAVGSASLKELRTLCEREYVLHVLERAGWNLSAAARRLGIQRTYLHAKLLALAITRPR